jgi:hypothetical protein
MYHEVKLITVPRTGDILDAAGFRSGEAPPCGVGVGEVGLPPDLLGPLHDLVEVSAVPGSLPQLYQARFRQDLLVFGGSLIHTSADDDAFAEVWAEFGVKPAPAGRAHTLWHGDILPKPRQAYWGVDWSEPYAGQFQALRQPVLLEFFAYETIGALVSFVNDYAEVRQATLNGVGIPASLYGAPTLSDHSFAWLAPDPRVIPVDIAYWYYRKADLFYSVRRVKDNWYYDFAYKAFKLIPATPRAYLPLVRQISEAPGFVYYTKLSGRLDDGEYVVTIRDGTKDVMVGAMCLYMKNGMQVATPEAGLEDQPLEDGLPNLSGRTRRSRPPRLVDTGSL